MKKFNLFLLMLTVASSLFISSCDKDDEKKAEEVDSTLLYYRLGGQAAIELVVDEFLTNVVADDRINAFFAETNEARYNNLRKQLIDQICDATGGPCVYGGLSMVEVHTGMNITEADFTALVEDLIAALDEYSVPEKEKNELLGALGGLKDQIVGL